MKKAIGVDIGGTKVAIAVIYEDGTIENRLDYQTPNHDAEALFRLIVEGIERVLQESQTIISDYCGIGLGVPGKVDKVKGIAIYQNNIKWPNFPIVQRLENVFPETVIKIDNDVKVAAYAEYCLLKLAPQDMFTYLTISTGIACTNIINYQILRGCGFSGEIGFLQIQTAKGNNRLESIASGPSIANAGRSLYKNNQLQTVDVFRMWEQADYKATKIINQSIDAMAKTIYSIICLMDSKHIVLGGSVALKNPKYIKAIKDKVATFVHAEQAHILENIQLSTLEGHNGLVGAGLLVIPQV